PIPLRRRRHPDGGRLSSARCAPRNTKRVRQSAALRCLAPCACRCQAGRRSRGLTAAGGGAVRLAGTFYSAAGRDCAVAATRDRLACDAAGLERVDANGTRELTNHAAHLGWRRLAHRRPALDRPVRRRSADEPLRVLECEVIASPYLEGEEGRDVILIRDPG